MSHSKELEGKGLEETVLGAHIILGIVPVSTIYNIINVALHRAQEGLTSVVGNV